VLHTASYSFEVIPDPSTSTGAYITEADANSDIGNDDDEYIAATCSKSLLDQEGLEALNDIGVASFPASHDSHFVFPCDRIDHIPDCRPPHHAVPVSGRRRGQAPTKQLLGWIFGGRLDRITPAYIFAGGPPISKELVELFGPCRVETGSFEQVADDTGHGLRPQTHSQTRG